jgi:acetolactate synthase I/III small subunit
MPPRLDQPIERRTFAVLVEDEPGVLARVVGLFSARGYNIESLTVAHTDRAENRSRITIVTAGQAIILEQIKAQLERIVSVHAIVDVSQDPLGLERELALVKVRAEGAPRIEALRVSEIFRAKVVDTTLHSFIFEITGASDKIDAFIELMRPLGLVEVSRTGVLSSRRGAEAS